MRSQTVCEYLLARSMYTLFVTNFNEDLLTLGKLLPDEPHMDHYHHEDPIVVVRHHVKFLQAVAAKTQRINPGALASIVKELWQLSKGEAVFSGVSGANPTRNSLRIQETNGAPANGPAGLGWQRRERYRPSLSLQCQTSFVSQK